MTYLPSNIFETKSRCQKLSMQVKYVVILVIEWNTLGTSPESLLNSIIIGKMMHIKDLHGECSLYAEKKKR